MGHLARMQTLPTLPSSSLDILDLHLCLKELTHKVAYGTDTGHDKVHLLYSTSTPIQGHYTLYVILPYTNLKP